MVGATASAQEGGVIQALRSDDETKKLVSSVDNADTPAGLVATVWVLVGAQADGRVGHYGNVGSTDGWLPKLPEEKTSP
jgi:hypothetical protein